MVLRSWQLSMATVSGLLGPDPDMPAQLDIQLEVNGMLLSQVYTSCEIRRKAGIQVRCWGLYCTHGWCMCWMGAACWACQWMCVECRGEMVQLVWLMLCAPGVSCIGVTCTDALRVSGMHACSSRLSHYRYVICRTCSCERSIYHTPVHLFTVFMVPHASPRMCCYASMYPVPSTNEIRHSQWYCAECHAHYTYHSGLPSACAARPQQLTACAANLCVLPPGPSPRTVLSGGHALVGAAPTWLRIANQQVRWAGDWGIHDACTYACTNASASTLMLCDMLCDPALCSISLHGLGLYGSVHLHEPYLKAMTIPTHA